MPAVEEGGLRKPGFPYMWFFKNYIYAEFLTCSKSTKAQHQLPEEVESTLG